MLLQHEDLRASSPAPLRNALPESRRALVAYLASSLGWRRLDERIQAVSAKIESLS
jgi:hypothetical protein